MLVTLLQRFVETLRDVWTLAGKRALIVATTKGISLTAIQSYRRALELVTNDSERRFLERRLREVQS